MKIKKVWSGMLAVVMALSTLGGGTIGAAADGKAVVTLNAATSTALYSYIDYTLGTLKDGGYQGYAFTADYNYADKAAMDADVSLAVSAGAGSKGEAYDVEKIDGKGKPVLFDNSVKDQTYLTQNFPETDENNIAKPAAGLFSILRYAEADSSVSVCDLRVGTHCVRKKDSFLYQKRTSSVENIAVKGVTLNDDNILSAKAYRDETNSSAATATLWLANETKKSGFVLQEKDFSPAYPKPAEKGYLSIRHQSGGSTGAKETWMSSEAYEKEEFVLRQAIAVTEDKIKQSGMNVNIDGELTIVPATNKLILADAVEGLDLDNKVEITWSSDQKSIIADDGTIQSHPDGTTVKLTATYTLLDEAGQPDASKQKEIEYAMTFAAGEVAPGMVISATPEDPDSDPRNMVDGDRATYWQSGTVSDFASSPAAVVLNLDGERVISRVIVTPRKFDANDASSQVGKPLGYRISTTMQEDQTGWQSVATGTIAYDDVNSDEPKSITFTSGAARYVKIEITSVDGGGQSVSIAELSVDNGISGGDDKIDGMQFYHQRDGFSNSYLKFKAGGTARVAFLGGSITEKGTGGYRDNMQNYLKKTFPQTTFSFVQAGISSTDSTLGAFRLDKDVLSKGEIDLLFVEFAVNDESNKRTEEEERKGMEGIFRQAWSANPNMDIMTMYFQMDKDRIHNATAISNHEKVAEHYNVTSLDFAREINARIEADEFSWDDFGGTHPSDMGHKIYSDGMIQILEESWNKMLPDAVAVPKQLPGALLTAGAYVGGHYQDIADAKLVNGFAKVEDWLPDAAIGGSTRPGFRNVPTLAASTPDSELEFTFTGTDVGILNVSGPDAGKIAYSVDGGAEKTLDLFTAWSKTIHLPWAYVLESGLERKEHTLKIRMLSDKNGASKGTGIYIQQFLVNTPLLKKVDQLADAFSWADISNGQDSGAVRGDLSFLSEYANPEISQDAATIEWSVESGGNVVDKDGKITRDPFADVPAVVKATLSIGSANTAEKKFSFTVSKAASEREEAEAIADRIKWESLTDENADRVTRSFHLPMSDVTSDGKTVEIGWKVTDGSSVVKIENGEAVVTPDSVSDVAVQLTATVVVGEATETRFINFVVVSAPTDTVMEYYHMDFTKPGAAAEYAELVGEPVIAGSVGADAYAKFVEGQGLQMQTAGAGDSNNLSVTLNLKGAVSDVGGFQKLKTVNTTELTFEIAQNTGTLAPKTNFIFQDENGAAFAKASVVPTKIGFGPNNGFLSAALTNSVPWTADSSYNKLYKNGGNRITVSMQITFDNMTNELMIFAKLPDYVGDKGYDEYIRLVPDEKLMVTDADTKQNICRLQIMSMGNNIANIKSIRSYTSISAIKSVTDSQVRGIAWLNGQDPDFVISDLNLPSAIDQYGASLRWEIAPEGVFDETGKLLKTDLDGHNDVQVTVCPVVTFQYDAYAAATPIFNPTTITVAGYNRNNLARGKKVTLTGATAAEGSQAGNITDGNMRSSLITTGGESGLEAVIDLGALTWVNTVRLTEGEPKNIAKYEVSISKNKKEWQSAGIVTDLNNTEVVAFADDSYRYVKLQVLEKKNAALPVTIAEIEAEYTLSEDFKNKNDIETVKMPDGVITGDFELMAVGEAYGSPIKWTTSKPEVLEITGPANGKYIVKLHKPEKSTVVSLTATIGDYNCSVPCSVQGTGGNGGGSGSGGSGGGGGKGGGVIGYVPPVSTSSGDGETETKASRHFSDVTDEYEWAAGSIDALYEKGIINGLDDGSFAPDALVTRAEYVKMLTIALGIEPKADAAIPFDDTSREDWAYPFIAAAYEMGLVQGISETEFGMDQPISRQDIAVMTVRALEAAGKKIEEKTEAAHFADEANIADYAAESIRRMQEGGILSGTPDGEFCPEGAATRAESAKILYLTIN